MNSSGTLPPAGEVGAADPVDETLVEHIWQEFQGKASRTLVHQIIKETMGEFAHATVTTYVPIFVKRRARQKLAVVLGN